MPTRRPPVATHPGPDTLATTGRRHSLPFPLFPSVPLPTERFLASSTTRLCTQNSATSARGMRRYLLLLQGGELGAEGGQAGGMVEEAVGRTSAKAERLGVACRSAAATTPNEMRGAHRCWCAQRVQRPCTPPPADQVVVHVDDQLPLAALLIDEAARVHNRVCRTCGEDGRPGEAQADGAGANMWTSAQGGRHSYELTQQRLVCSPIGRAHVRSPPAACAMRYSSALRFHTRMLPLPGGQGQGGQGQGGWASG